METYSRIGLGLSAIVAYVDLGLPISANDMRFRLRNDSKMRRRLVGLGKNEIENMGMFSPPKTSVIS